MADACHPCPMSTQEVLSFAAVYSAVEGGWVQAQLVEIPAVVTVASTRDEAEEMLADALREYLLSFAAAEAPTPPKADPAWGALDLTITPRSG